MLYVPLKGTSRRLFPFFSKNKYITSIFVSPALFTPLNMHYARRTNLEKTFIALLT